MILSRGFLAYQRGFLKIYLCPVHVHCVVTLNSLELLFHSFLLFDFYLPLLTRNFESVSNHSSEECPHTMGLTLSTRDPILFLGLAQRNDIPSVVSVGLQSDVF